MDDTIEIIRWKLSILVQTAGEGHKFTKVSYCYPSDAVIAVNADAAQSGPFADAQKVAGKLLHNLQKYIYSLCSKTRPSTCKEFVIKARPFH